MPEHVVGHQHAARPQTVHEPVEQRLVELLAAVLEDQIEGPGDLVQESRGVADDHVDPGVDARAHEVLTCRGRTVRVQLHRQQLAVGGQRQRHAGGRVADGRADLEDATGAERDDERAKQPGRGRIDQRQSRGQPFGANGLEDRLERWVMAGRGSRARVVRLSGAWRTPIVSWHHPCATPGSSPPIGPATSTPEMLDALLRAGVDIFRLNFSHGTHESHRATIEAIRAAEARGPRVVAILQDLAGPKIRTGRLAGGTADRPGQGRPADHPHRRRASVGPAKCSPPTRRLQPASSRDSNSCSTTAASCCAWRRTDGDRDPDDRRARLAAGRAQGHHGPRRRAALRRADGERRRGPALWHRGRRGHDRAVVCPARRGRACGARRARGAGQALHADRRQARAAAGDRAARPDPRRGRRGDGGARRPGPGSAARTRAAPAEGDHAPGARAGPAGDCRHAGARVDAQGASSDARRSERRRQRRRRRRRRDHAGGRDRVGRVSRSSRSRRSTRSSARPSSCRRWR